MRTLYLSDGPADRRLLQGLAELRHVVETAADRDEALDLAGLGDWRVVVCDLKAADPELIAAVARAAPEAWVVAIVAAGGEADRIALLRAGAELALTRPVEFRELGARLEALSRRALRSGVAEAPPQALELRPAEHAVTVDGETVALSPQEFALIAFLAGRPGEVISLERILDSVWGGRVEPRPELVHTYVSRLRSKLERGRSWKLLHAVRGHGYSFRLEPAEGGAARK